MPRNTKSGPGSSAGDSVRKSAASKANKASSTKASSTKASSIKASSSASGSGPGRAPADPAAPPMLATGQRRSLERGKATHKKNPGKRANQGG